MKKIITLLIGFCVLSACSMLGLQTNGQANKKMILDSMSYGLLGSSANRLSKFDLTQALTAEYTALEYVEKGKIVKWQSKTSNSNGSVTPGQPYKVGSQNCRQYRHDFIINGVPQTVRGSACRNEDGSWSPLT